MALILLLWVDRGMGAGQEHPQGAVPLLDLGSLSSSLQDLNLMTQGEVLKHE